MKELSIEEKAKRYDEALHKAKNYYSTTDSSSDIKLIGLIFPELAESEDERIQKSLIDMLKNDEKCYLKEIAWLEKQGCLMRALQISNGRIGELIEENYYLKENLEKQGKQKANIIVPRFEVGDWVINTITKEVEQVIELTDTEYICSGHLIISFTTEGLLKRWTIQDAKDGDVLATSAGAFIYNGNNGGGSCLGSYCGIDTSGRFKTGVEHHWTGKKVYPATKEQRDQLEKAMADAGYRWNADEKKLEKIEQNPAAWSDEDEKQARQIERIVHDDGCTQKLQKQIADWLKSIKDRIQPQSQSDERYRLLGKLKEWLDEYVSNLADVDTDTLICSFTNYLDGKLPKSLRPQNTWKPSDEQMNALNYVVNLMASSERPIENDLYYNILKSLRQQLMKLKDEK